jgi:predicted ATPase
MITRLAISGYRSLRELRVTLGPLNVVTGANGSGKSSLYRALKLLADIAQGRIIQSLAAEGGLQSTLWAGPEQFSRAMKAGTQPVQGLVRKNSVSLKLGFRQRLRLRHRSRTARIGLDVCKRPGNKGRESMDRRAAGPRERVRDAQRPQRSHPKRKRRVATGLSAPGIVRQHDDALRRSPQRV